jgi:cellulose synthase/poly-beta-1,6-N-acetylglucosamine synthase-like glycosyltransferase
MRAGGDLPSTSVIVPAYQAEATLGDCLESLVGLDYPRDRIEIVCVDNDSTDDTARIARSFAPAVTTVHESRRGPAAARNRGVAVACGEVIAFTDADCTVAPEWLCSLVPALADERVGVAGGRILARRPCNWVERFGERIHDHLASISQSRPATAITMNWASRRDVLERMGGFDERFLRCQDSELSLRMVRAGLELVYVDDAIVYHRNESTIAGLAREGYVHGYHAPAVLALHSDYLSAFPPAITPLRRVWEALRALSSEGRPADRMLRLVFDCGKAWGAARAAMERRNRAC